jgi:integrase
MPHLLNRNPSYRRHRASGQAIVTLNGKDFYLGPWRSAASKAEYDRLMGEYLANGRRIDPVDAGEMTISGVLARFLDHAKAYYVDAAGNRTADFGHFGRVMGIVRRLYAEKSASAFGPLALESVRNAMIAEGWSRTYINAQVGRVKRIFAWAVSRELIPPAIHQALVTLPGLRQGKTVAHESAPVRPVADELVDAVLPFLSPSVRAMVTLQRLTGARSGEICSMRIGEIDRSGDVWAYRPASHKNTHRGHARTIYVGPKAQDVLRPYLLKMDPTAFVFSPAEAERERREALHAARTIRPHYGNRPGTNRVRHPKKQPGKRYDSKAYRRAITYACAKAFPVPAEIAGDVAKVADWRREHQWHPHQLRHASATAIRKTFGLEAAQSVLGHATLAAAQIYAEKSSETAREVAAAVG